MLRRVFGVAGWVGFGAILILSLVPGSERPRNAFGFPGEYEHLLAYLLTTGALGLASPKLMLRAALLILLVLCAAFLETAQIWIPGRTARLIDFAASSTGVGVGLLAAAMIDHLVFPSPDGELGKEQKPEPWG